MKRIFIIFILLCLVPMLTGGGLVSPQENKNVAENNTGKNLVKNGGFETVKRQDLPDFWIKHTFDRDRSGVRFSLVKDHPYSGKYSAAIENITPNDAKWIQFVKVKPATVYRLSCRIKAEGIGRDKTGANISVLGIAAASGDLKDTGGKWAAVEFYGRTGPEQNEFAAVARLGGDGSPNTGKAFFDEFRVEEVAQPPAGITIVSLQKEPEPEPEKPVDNKKLTGRIILFSLLFYTLCMALYFFVRRRKAGVKQWPAKKEESPARAKFSRRDYILCGALTVVYAIIAFINLGSFKAPLTYWNPAQRNESIIADFGEVKHIDRLYYFFGVGRGRYRVEFSEDLQNWTPRKSIEQATQYEKLQWRFIGIDIDARYCRFTVIKPGARFNEAVFFEPGSREPIPVVSIEHRAGKGLAPGSGLPFPGADKMKEVRSPKAVTKADPLSVPGNVFDEQDTVAYHPDYKSGMYFDEVYHARTAYEHLHRIEPSETTHPPLGKVFISFGIALFGMTPFGWRFIGTLFGILMIPIMYKFGLLIFKRTRYAFITAFLMAFDFMHFVQTRIATIDVYGLFFIILMYYFMYKYFTMNFYRDGLKKTLVPLFLSGLFFGFGAACKWITIYGGIGLAIIFFASLFLRYREYNRAKSSLLETKQKFCGGPGGGFSKEPPGRRRQDDSKSSTNQFPRYAVITLSWCLLFFIIIPLVIYGLSYIPFMMVPGPGHGPGDVVANQGHMYNYHSELKASHPFSSTWWQWPIMKTPVWYYGGEHKFPAGKMATIAALGNPAVWWIGSIAVLIAVFLAFKYRDPRMFVILIAFAAQYLTWAIAPRDCTFIYHFFGAVPFIILCITYIINFIEDKIPKSRHFVNGYLVLVLLLFLMFYPILSGMMVSKAYAASCLRWFDSWIFFT